MFGSKKEDKKPLQVSNEAITTIIGEDMMVSGELKSNSSIRIEGKVEGNVTAQKMIIIGEKAFITGDICAKHIIVYGNLKGNVGGTEIYIKKTGVIHGDISVQAIEIEMGGKYNGRLLMTSTTETGRETLKHPKNISVNQPNPQEEILQKTL